jgi:hypothetical protein
MDAPWNPPFEDWCEISRAISPILDECAAKVLEAIMTLPERLRPYARFIATDTFNLSMSTVCFTKYLEINIAEQKGKNGHNLG